MKSNITKMHGQQHIKIYFRGIQFEERVEEMDVLNTVFFSHIQFLQTNGVTVAVLTQALLASSYVVCTFKSGCLNCFPHFKAANMKISQRAKILNHFS